MTLLAILGTMVMAAAALSAFALLLAPIRNRLRNFVVPASGSAPREWGEPEKPGLPARVIKSIVAKIWRQYYPSPRLRTSGSGVFWNNIQLLRVIAAYGIVYIHLASVFAALHVGHALIELLRFATDLFVVVAGFLSAHVLLGPPGKSAYAYLRDRAVRIIPLYLIFTILAFCVVNLLMRGHQTNFGELLMSLAFIPYGPFPVLYPTWTLEIIVEFTLIIFIFQLVSRPYGVYLSSVFVVLIAIGGLLSGSTNPMIIFYTNPILINFAFGIVVFVIATNQFLVKMLLRFGASPVLAILFICTAAVFLRPFYWPELSRLIALGIPAAGVLLAAVLLERLGVFARSNLVNFLAKCSYSIYLCHWFVNIIPEKILALEGDSQIVAALFLVITPIAVTYVAVFVYLYVEEPITRYLIHRLT